MHSLCRLPARLFSVVIGLAASAALSLAQDEPFYFVGKTQVFRQTSAGGAVAGSFGAPAAGFAFRAAAGSNVSLTLPSGAVMPVTRSTLNGEIELVQAFTTKAALDAAFPNGSYRMTGASIPALSFNLGVDSYPATTPQIVGGAWSNGGMLIINPLQNNTLSFSTFADWGANGATSHLSVQIHGMNDNVNLEGEIASRPIFGLPVQAAPLSTIALPANLMTSGRVYEGRVTFDTAVTVDSTTVPGGGVVSLFTKDLYFYIVAQAPNAPDGLPILITGQPTNQTAALGGTATIPLTFTVGGGPPTPANNPGVFWYFNGRQINVDGGKFTFSPNSAALRVNNLTAADVGSYTAVIIGAGGVVTSNAATITVSGPVAPAITQPPIARNITPGSTVVFSAGVSGSPTPTLQWRRDGVDIPGANGATLVLSGSNGPNGATPGQYALVATNSAGTVTSTPVTLNVLVNENPSRLINLSILTLLSPGETMTMGTVLGGTGTSGTKPLLARAAGPSLQQLSINNYLPDPTMALNSTASNPAVTVASNNDWAGNAALSTAFAQVGAFGYIATNSRDAAIFRPDLPAGPYTVSVNDTTSTGSGVVIAELYDSTPSDSFTASTPRLINVSVLKQIPVGGLTAGFVIGGTTAKTVMIRAVGPTLGGPPFGLTGLLADPQLTLFNSSQATIAANNDWGGDPAISSVTTRVGAFALANPGSRDAVLLVTLNPGNYTAEVRGNGANATGLAIVEVYEVP